MRPNIDRECRGLTRVRTSFTAPILVTTALVLALTGCGGGGSSKSNSTGVTMSVTPQSISVTATTTQPAPTPSILVNFAGLSQSQDVYVGAQNSGQGINQVINNGGALPAAVVVQLDSPADLGPGTYDGTVQVEGCLDQACSRPVGNSPQTVHVQYTITKSTFTVIGLSPASDYAGAQSFTLQVNGTSFTPQSTVLWNGTQLSTTFVNSSQLTAQVPADDIAQTGAASVSVSDPTNGTTNTESFTIKGSSLTLSALSPASIVVGNPAFTLTLTGTGFTSQSTVLWNGNAESTVFVSPTQLEAEIPASDTAVTGSNSVSVNDPTYGTSSSLTFAVTPVVLALNSISPTTVAAGGSSFMLTVLGTAFTGTSVIEWNGAVLPTTLVSSTELVAKVPASNISATGTASVTVSDPNSPPGTTAILKMTVAAPSIDAVAYQINPAHSGAVTFASASFPTTSTWSVDVKGTPSYALIADGKVFVTVLLSSGSEVLALKQATGTYAWGPILLSGKAVATYDKGKVFVVSGEGGAVTAYDASTGALDWNTSINKFSVFTGLPTASDGTVYVIGEGTAFALNEADGTLLWTTSVGTSAMSAAVTVDGVYSTYSCESEDLRPATGEVIWKYSNGCNSSIYEMPAVANQLDYSLGDVFDAETGTSDGSYLADSLPSIATTMGYFLHSGTLSGVTLSNNTAEWSFTGDGTLDGAPIAVNQYVFIGSSSGNLYAIDSTTGNQAWNVTLGAAIDANYIYSTVPFSGLAAGDGLLVVPSGTTVTAYTLSTNP